MYYNNEESDIIYSYISQLRQNKDVYDSKPAKGLVHGFQKDAIQNGWGHRLSKKGENWKFTISYIENEKGKFIVVEDHGCTGLIGKNYNKEELKKYQEEGTLIPPQEKLARFCTLYFSGGNTTSAGLFGRGKLMYQLASNDYIYYFDSLTENGNYVANWFNKMKTCYPSLEGDEAINWIKFNTGMDKKLTTGTRIIITNPNEEIVSAIKNGNILNDINETWWLIFKKYNACVEVYDNGKLIGTGAVPKIYADSFVSSNKWFYEDSDKLIAPGYRMKKIYLCFNDIDEELPEELSNIYYYRNNMKIGKIIDSRDLEVDEKFKNKIFGYIEVDKEWEKELEENEHITHYAIKNANMTNYQNLKKAVKTHLSNYAIKMGLKKNDKAITADQEITKLADDLTDFLRNCDIDLELNPNKNNKRSNGINIIINKDYPNDELRTLEYGQLMKFNYKLSKEVMDNEYNVKIFVSSPRGGQKLLFEDNIIFYSNVYHSDDIEISFDDFFKKERNVVKVVVKSNSHEDIQNTSTFPVYVDIDEETTVEDFVLRLENINFPNEYNREVVNGESISNLKVLLQNNTNKNVEVQLSCLIQDVGDRNNTIEVIKRDRYMLLPDEPVFDMIDEIFFDSKYINRKGNLKIKYILSHINGIEEYDKGTILKEININFIYEATQEGIKTNIFETSINSDDKTIKSKWEHNPSGSGYLLKFNQNYILYKTIKDEPDSIAYKVYFIEEMLKTIISIKLDNYDYEILGVDKETIERYDAKDIDLLVKNTVDRYISEYFESRG